MPIPPKLRILARQPKRVIRLSSTCHIMPYLEVVPLEASNTLFPVRTVTP